MEIEPSFRLLSPEFTALPFFRPEGIRGTEVGIYKRGEFPNTSVGRLQAKEWTLPLTECHVGHSSERRRYMGIFGYLLGFLPYSCLISFFFLFSLPFFFLFFLFFFFLFSFFLFLSLCSFPPFFSILFIIFLIAVVSCFKSACHDQSRRKGLRSLVVSR